MKRLLFICPRPIFPVLWGERIRYFNNLTILKSHYQIDVLFLTANKKELEPDKELDKYVCNKYVFYQPKLYSILQVIKGLIMNRYPLQVNYFFNRKAQKWLNRNSENYDVIFCNNIRTSRYAMNLNNNKILDFVDAISMNYEKAIERSKGMWKIVYLFEKKRILAFEKKMLHHFDSCCIISEIDRNYILKNEVTSKLNIVRNFIDDVYYSYADVVDYPYRIGFVGKMNYEPNVTAVHYWTNEVFPAILTRFPASEFYIIGGYPSNSVKRLGKRESVVITGFVDDIYKAIAECDIIVAPMLSGAGLQNKIIQSMMLCKCVITSPLGAEGLPSLMGNELLIANSTEEYIDIVYNLFDSKSRKNEIAMNAHEYVLKNFSKAAICEQLLKVVQ